VLQAELQKAQSQHNELQKQLDTLSASAHQNVKDEQARAKQLELQQALERSQADVNALQRELLRVNQGGR
jgi:predicted RNase H-like nuclease (RuvC/YqgF family)